MAAVSATLNEELEKVAPSEVLEVVVELTAAPPDLNANEQASRSEKISAARESFHREAAPVEEAIRRVGGEITGRAWINQTLRARVPADGIKELAAEEKIKTVDLPHSITPDQAALPQK